MEIKDRLREKRLSLGLTQEYVAEKVGTTKQTIQKYECGIIKNIPQDKVEALAKALNCSPAYLMGWEDNKQSQPEDNTTLVFHRNGQTERIQINEDDVEFIEQFLKRLKK